MPIKINYKSEQEVRDIPMTGLVSYSEVIDETYRLIEEKGLKVNNVIYKPNANGDTVAAIFIIDDENLSDKDLTLSLTWVHSYHKAIRFQCNISGYTTEGAIMVRDQSAPNAKLRRASDAEKYKQEIFSDIKLEINFYKDTFNKIVEFKNGLIKTNANISAAAVSLGVLYVEEDVLTTSQASVIKDLLLAQEVNTGYDVYRCFAEGLKDSHPKTFLIDHIKAYAFFEDVFAMEEVPVKKEELVFKDNDKGVNEDIKKDLNFTSSIPSIVFI